MGYYSNAAINNDLHHGDCTHIPHEQQLLWHLEELEARLEELNATSCKYESRNCFSKSALLYSPAEYFSSATDVRAAIELTRDALEERYGICTRTTPMEAPIIDELTGMQISLFEFHLAA